MHIKYCKYCGSEIKDENRRKYCSAECMQRAEEDRKQAKKEQAENRKNPNKELEKVVRQAKAEGLSYGQYCVKHGLY